MDSKLIKRQLKGMSKSDLKVLFEKAELEEEEKWLLRYAFVEDRLVLNTCAKLSISEATYYRMLSKAIIKIYYTLKFN